ncbi:hypothetical protein PPACK8108_LOCUS6044 [Phakopsora pachyrhizi]|uniref:COMPASS complex Set1 subunit N-SET domain-containing protein n=1 Tax=Phakopsora pachyrhizi TaxID=170000 RepID=A0AAV0ARX1_PHAPC|nr:hypothetical protein PPACK8108_LOCUS6044 [Phakopsora pachyrhizi]
MKRSNVTIFDGYPETGWIGFKAGTNQLFKASFCRTRIPIVRLPEDLINSAQELLDSITNQSTIRTSALGLYSKYQLIGLKKTLELDQKEILIKYLDLLQNQAIKDSELKKKNSNDGDGEALERLRGDQSLHPPVSEKPEPPTNESGGGNHINADQEFSEGTLLPHATGSLRTEGYYCITSSQKAFYLPQRNKAIIDVGSLFNNQSNVASASALAVSRSTRVNSRRFVVNMEQNKKASTLASASIDTVTDALKFNQLRARKKQLKFSRSPIQDVWFINPDHVVSQYQGCTECPLVSESHYKHGMGAGFSFESENILKKLETRFALLERCKENENLMQCWSLTKSNFNNCSTRQPLSLLRYSNSRFCLQSPAETVENLSSSALNKGLSLALERKISKSPCRTPPSRTAASETNLSDPAANFSHLQALSNSGSALSERAFDDSENLSTKGENQNLSRKSRIKRQDGYTSASSGNCLTSNWIPGGKGENYTYQHCLASSVNQQQILDKLSAPLIEKSSRSPNARISLLTGNGKDDMNSKPFPLQSEPEDELMSGAAVDDFKFDKDQPI